MMQQEITQLDHPIDVMYLIHKAIRAEAKLTRQAAEQLEMGGNFKTFMAVFYRWAMALGYHEETEYKYLIPHIPKSPPTNDNEVGHQDLLAGLEELQACLHEELGRTIVIPRTQRQLFGKVIALLIAQADLLEEEEEIILPVIREQMSQEQQLDIVKYLLFDFDSDDQHWILDWMGQHLTETERWVLADLVTRLDEAPDEMMPLSADTEMGQSVTTTSTVEPEITIPSDQMSFDHPIDVMMLIHKALSMDAWRTAVIAERLEIGETIQPLISAFDSWIKALSFHADMEDIHMTPLISDAPQAQENEAAHARLVQRVEELQTHIKDVRPQAVTAHIRRQLFGKIVALRIDQDDHLEEEEEFVLPIIRDRISPEQQLDMAAHLLLDSRAPNGEWVWVLDWIAQDLTDVERQSLARLTERFGRAQPPAA